MSGDSSGARPADQAGRAAPQAADASRPSGDHPSRERLLELAERCEAASGPDRELDCRIWAAINGGGYDTFVAVVPDLTQWTSVKPYTASVDAAMTLVPEGSGAGGERFKVEAWDGNGIHAQHVRASAWVVGARRVYAATPALSLTAAALRVRASITQIPSGEP